jgi:hypothetical protein
MRKAGVVYAILIVGILASSITIYQRVSETAAESRRNLDAEKLKNQYLERVAWMRANPEERSYQEDLRPFFRDYFAQVDEHVKRYQLNAKFDDYLTAVARRASQEDKKDVDTTTPKMIFERVSQTFTLLKEGRYAPFLTATDRGFRMDIVSDEVRKEGGGQVVFPVVLWGVQRELREDKSSRTQKMAAMAAFDAVWKLYDAKDKLIGEVRGGDPSSRVDYPERYIWAFPPQMMLGEYKIDRVPAEAEKAQLIVDVTLRASWGSTQHATFTYNFPVKREWKLAPGEAWQGATVSERSEEEINPQAAGAKK